MGRRFAGGGFRSARRDEFRDYIGECFHVASPDAHPHAVWHKITIPQLEALAPAWPWKAYFRQRNSPTFGAINVDQPDFFKETNRLLTETPLEQWKTYLRWHVIHASANELPDSFLQENFNLRVEAGGS
jgi:predicted metalloendopeptidase